MNGTTPPKRRNYFIKKRFQINFSVKFIIILAIEAVLSLALFLYMSKDTSTTGYLGSELKTVRTYEFFLTRLLISNFIIIVVAGVIGTVVMILLSHRIAGPLYRFEKVLDNIGKGDLTTRFKLRNTDQLMELLNSINGLAGVLDNNMGNLKSRIDEFSKLISEMQAACGSNPSQGKEMERILQEMSKKIRGLEEAANYFKTSP